VVGDVLDGGVEREREGALAERAEKDPGMINKAEVEAGQLSNVLITERRSSNGSSSGGGGSNLGGGSSSGGGSGRAGGSGRGGASSSLIGSRKSAAV